MLANRTGKLMLLYFMDESCGWCKKLDEEVFSDVTVRRFVMKHYVPVRIDIAKSTLDDDIGLAAVPTLAAAEPVTEGGQANVMVGYHGYEKTLLWLLSNARRAPNWIAEQ